MFEVARRLMMIRELEFKEGEVSLFGIRIMGIPAAILVKMLQIAKKRGVYDRISCLQYDAAKVSVRRWFKRFQEKTKLKGDELKKWQSLIFNLAGWGEFQLLVGDFRKKVGWVRVNKSCLAMEYLRAYGKSKLPVCYIIRGGIAGGGELFFNVRGLDADETQCIAQGFPYCVLIGRRDTSGKSK